MKSIKFAILIALTSVMFILSGCGSDFYRLNTMRKKFPDSEIVTIPDKPNIFIIRKPDGFIWYARCEGMSAESIVLDDIELLPKKK